MGKIKNIIFDFGGVLVDWNPRYLYSSYFRTEEEMEYFLENVCTFEWNSLQDKGRSFADGIKVKVAEFPEYKEAIEMFFSRWGEMLRCEIPATVDFLKWAKSAGFGVYGLTNWSVETIQISYERYSFFNLFDGIVVSGEEKIIKPDPELYKILLERYQLNPSECLFLDDNQANVSAAQALGIPSLRFTSMDEILPQLNELGINLSNPLHHFTMEL